MNFLLVLGIALALAMDAFGVSMGISALLRDVTKRQIFRVAFSFGLFQFLMPIFGWAAGRNIQKYIQAYDHWVGFGLLFIIGGRMIFNSLKREEISKESEHDPTKGAILFLLAVATSIDALAVGLSLAVLKVSIIYPAVVIGFAAFSLTVFGMKMGSLFGSLVRKRAELLGGAILIVVGIVILIEHL
jgi:putative Mn2+ efflux pump MntP